MNASYNRESESSFMPDVGQILKSLHVAVNYVDDAKLRDEFSAQIHTIERRYRDPYLKLLVIGDFSCGKSTLLNAIFRQELLSMDIMPTTVIPTYIRWNLNQGDDIRIKVFDMEGKSFIATGTDRETLQSYIGKPLPSEPGKLVDCLTTDNQLIDVLSRIELEFPVIEGREGICLIDTPGINPGMKGTQEHVNITRRLLSEEADATFILFPGNLVLSASLIEFLQGIKQTQLGDSYFLITKFDMVRKQQDREMMPELVRSRMETLMGRKPKVYTICAGSALNYYIDPAKATPEERKWAECFEHDIGEIFCDVTIARKKLLNEGLISMLRNLTAQIRLEVENGKVCLEEQKLDIERYSPEQMKKEIKILCNRTQREFSDVKDKYRRDSFAELEKLFQNAYKIFYANVMEKSNMYQVNSYLNKNVKKEIKQIGHDMQNKLRTKLPDFNSMFRNYQEEVNKLYMEYRVHIIDNSLDAGLSSRNKLQSEGNYDARIVPAQGTTVLNTLGDFFDTTLDLLDDLVSLNLLDALEDVAELFTDLVENIVQLFVPLKRKKEQVLDVLSASMEMSKRTFRNEIIRIIDATCDRYIPLIDELPEKYERTYHKEYQEAVERYREKQNVLYQALLERQTTLGTLQNLEQDLASQVDADNTHE